jgi:CBS-domain-containing membrane protein
VSEAALAARAVIHRNAPLRPGVGFQRGVTNGVFSAKAGFPLGAMPFAASVVIVLGSPKAELAQPRALIGGHLVSTFIGLLIVKLLGPGPWTAALAVGLAMVAMHLTGTFHPPAGIDPLVVVVKCPGASWSRDRHRCGVARTVRLSVAQARRARGQ